ncbi:helix-turn-helix domain-containing protein [Cohnella hashimotonis]|uniref:Helix-turn-helix domain-containing protein n=1 Tax=Cohnella hashimotonis TaxID=2826895 RepID=A0ABT6TE50_9BACL|nr:helix-turn-helix domain-containing protein [Cohnella hashimotonis]MDI4645086.1 helix-turn-helix domain-containing protein [Cohnella hashimotonis]
MKMLQAYKSKKYLTRMLMSVSVLMIAVLVFASLALQYNAERSSVRMQQDSSRKVMNQIQYNVSYMTEALNNLAVSLFMDPNISPLFTLPSYDEMTVIRSMNSLKQAYLSSSFLHSILVYNGYDDQVYPVGQLSLNKPDAAMADGLVSLLKREEKLPRMKLLPMNFSGNAEKIDFFSIVLYQNFGAVRSGRESALVVNIKPEWLYDNLQSVNVFDDPARSGLYMLDASGDVIMSGGGAAMADMKRLDEALARRAYAGMASFGSFTGKLGGSTKQLVTYMSMKDTDWKIVSVQPYSVVTGSIREMRATSVVVIAVVLLLGVLLTFLIAHKLYRPIERMFSQIGIKPGEAQGSDAGARQDDEFSTVATVYSSMLEKLHWASSEQDKQKRIVRNYHLRTLVANSPSLSREEFQDNIALNGLDIDPAGPYRLVVVKVDGFAEYERSTTPGQRALHTFAVGNIAEEIMRPGPYRCEIADMRGDHVAMLVSPAGEGADTETLTRLLRRVQEVVGSYYRLSLSLTVSGSCDSHVGITERYGEAIRLSRYKLLFGHRAILTPEAVGERTRKTEYDAPAEAEKKLVESIRANRPEDSANAADAIVQGLASCHFDHIVHGILHLVDLLKSAVRDLNRNRLVSLPIDLSSLSKEALEKETMEEVRELIGAAIREIHDKLSRTDADKNAALTDAIKEMIEINYKDSNLSLQGIAAMLHLTPAYVGRIFKTSEFVSVGEYMNEVRLRHAQAYLETKGFSIKEVMELVGYVNESTFFKLFKKTFGVTPKEYRLKKVLE